MTNLSIVFIREFKSSGQYYTIIMLKYNLIIKLKSSFLEIKENTQEVKTQNNIHQKYTSQAITDAVKE